MRCQSKEVSKQRGVKAERWVYGVVVDGSGFQGFAKFYFNSGQSLI